MLSRRLSALCFASLVSLPALLVATSAFGETVNITPADDVEVAMNALLPGDELILAGGTYTVTNLTSISIAGTEVSPIIIRAKDGEQPHIMRPNANQNIIDFTMAHYVEVHGIEFSGGSAGVRLGDVNNFTLESCEIHSTADVALRANNSGSVYDKLRIIGNHIHDTDDTGEGMYLGCNNNACQVSNSVIQGNYVHHTNQNSVVQGDGIELKEGSFGNIIADNVIHDTNYPCILTYSTVGNGAANIVERNVMWNCGDHAIQSAADTTIRNNIILSAVADGIRCQPHQSGAPQNIQIVHNTVVKANNNAIRCSGIVGAVTIANNALYAQNNNAIRVDGDLGALSVLGNVGVGGLQGLSSGFDATGDLMTDLVAATYTGAPPNDVFPAVGSALVAAGDATAVVDIDFNGTSRNGVADVGAYAYDAAGNPGWTIGEGFKVPVAGGGGEGGSGQGGSAQGGAGQGGGTAGAGQGGGNGAVVSAGATTGGGGGDLDDDGCGCRTARGTGNEAPAGALLGFGLAALALRRRRRDSI